jgi:hypothetical protein
MELIKRKRLLENYRSRQSGSYGEITASTIDISLYITHTYEDMGIYSNSFFDPYDDDFMGPNKLKREDINIPVNFNSAIDGRHPLMGPEMYNQTTTTVSGEMDDRYLNSVASYQVDKNNNPIYKPNLNMSKDINKIYDGVLSVSEEEVNYVTGGISMKGGEHKPNTGISFNSKINSYVDDLITGKRWRETTFTHTMGGLRTTSNGELEANVSLYALYKKEELLNIVEPPKVRNRVFISRGGEDIFERHSIMSEIKTRDDIDEYRNGYF